MPFFLKSIRASSMEEMRHVLQWRSLAKLIGHAICCLENKRMASKRGVRMKPIENFLGPVHLERQKTIFSKRFVSLCLCLCTVSLPAE